MSVPFLLVSAAFSLGCANNEGTAAWALNFATVTPEDEQISGVHVWEFFADGWEKKQKEKFYQCSLVQSLTGELDDAGLSTCEHCVAYYSVRLEEVDGDCDADVTSDPGLEGVHGFGVGMVDSAFAEEDPFPGASMGWYISFDGETFLFHGFAFPEALERGGTPDGSGWGGGETYSLWPVYAWQL